MENVRNFFFLGSKFTADGDYSHEIKIYIYIYIYIYICSLEENL